MIVTFGTEARRHQQAGMGTLANRQQFHITITSSQMKTVGHLRQRLPSLVTTVFPSFHHFLPHRVLLYLNRHLVSDLPLGPTKWRERDFVADEVERAME